MKKRNSKNIICGLACIVGFVVWTFAVQLIDVKPIGVNGTDIGFSTVNSWFHSLTGVNMTLYTITDWLGLVPVFACVVFAIVGVAQLIKRRSILKVDFDIILLGVYYVVVIFGYVVFEMIPINYRPILINGIMEASYPSSTTLLVLSVMPTVVLQSRKRVKNDIIKMIITIVTILFSLFMVVGRLISGVHWFTDIIGAIILSAGLFLIYKGGVTIWNSTKSFRN